jgi:hypothetical protein
VLLPAERQRRPADPGQLRGFCEPDQMLFRDVNERVEALEEGFSSVAPVGAWVCECANGTCSERVEMSASEYEEIRSGGARFFVAPSDEHLWPDVEVVTKRNDRYWIVVKVGQAGKLVKSGDPRPEHEPA